MNYEEYVEEIRKRGIKAWTEEIGRLRYRNPGLEVALDVKTKRAVFG